MSQIQIILPEDTTKKLKILAMKADRPLKKFIPLYLNTAVDLNIIDIDERTGAFVTSTSQTQSQLQSQTITLDQLRDAGIKDFKFSKPERELTPEEQSIEQQKLELQQQKLELEKQKVKKQRVKFLKEKCEQILGYMLPYLEKDEQTVIDLVLNKYPTDEEIVAYLERLKEEDEHISDNDPNFYDYRKEIETLEDALPHPLEENYQKIKDYCVAYNNTFELYQLLLHPSAIQVENYDHVIKPALDTPADYEYEKEELDLIASYFMPENK